MAIVLIPGIKGSELVDSYLLSWPRRWSMEDMVVGDILVNNERMGLGLGLAALLLLAGPTRSL